VISVHGLMGTPDPGEGVIVETDYKTGGESRWSLGPFVELEIRRLDCNSIFSQIVAPSGQMRLCGSPKR
jgi:hypothetical protein